MSEVDQDSRYWPCTCTTAYLDFHRRHQAACEARRLAALTAIADAAAPTTTEGAPA